MIWRRPTSDGCLSNLALDELLGQELGAGESAVARVHLDGCSRCRARLAEIEAERDRFRQVAPPLALPRPAARRIPTLALAAGALGAAAVLVFLLRPAPGTDRLAPPADAVQGKGGIRLAVYIKRGDAVLAGRSGDIVHPGEAIRFAYSSLAGGYLAILGRDGAGRVSVYYPDGDSAAPIERADEVVLPGSIILDDVLGPEVVHAVHCAAPVEVARLADALRAGSGALAIAGCSTDRLILDKRP
jgi:anti-sigma factor RsiW